MESSAISLTRVLGGVFFTLVAAVSIVVLDEEGDWTDGWVWMIPTSLALMSALLLALIISGKDREHGSWLTDTLVSRESEYEMRLRLEKEMEEASLQNLGTNWAKMEMGHLETKHGEE